MKYKQIKLINQPHQHSLKQNEIKQSHEPFMYCLKKYQDLDKQLLEFQHKTKLS